MMKFNYNVFKSNCNSLSKQFNQVHSTCVVYHDICQQTSACKQLNDLDTCNSSTIDEQHELKCGNQTCSNDNLDNQSTTTISTPNNCKIPFSTNTTNHHHYHNHEHGLIYSKRVRSILLLNALLSKPNQLKDNTITKTNQTLNNQTFLSSKWHLYTEQIRNYAKKASSKKKNQSNKKLDDFDDNELSQCIDLNKFRIDLDDVIENLKNEFINNINIRIGTNIELLEIDIDGELHQLKDIARLTKKNNLISIDCSELPEYAVHVMKSLRDSGMNVNPQQDGTTIYFQQIKSTKDHREQLAKNCKQLLQKSKDNLKHLQSDYIKKANLKKADKISVDVISNCCDYIRLAIQESLIKCTELYDQKVKQLLDG